MQERRLGDAAKEGYRGDEVVGPAERKGVSAGRDGGWRARTESHVSK